MENLPIDSDTLNKSIDLIDESTKETRKAIDNTTAKGINKLAQLFWASPIGIKTDIYIQERPYKMKKALKEMQMKYEKAIPVEYQVEPSSYIALKGVNELNYSLDEEHLKEMFQNLLISDMDSRKKNKVLPSYIEIIKQISKDDAEFLLLLKKEYLFPLIEILLKENSRSGAKHLDKFIIYDFMRNNNITQASTLQLNPLIIDNLSYLNLIKIDFDSYYTNKMDEYSYLFNLVKKNYVINSSTHSLDYKKGFIEFTELGKNFIDICLS